jgi:hypothetical protein
MNVALATDSGRVAPCFAGVELWIVNPSQSAGARLTVSTVGLDPSLWARELVRRDVGVLLCAGIDMFAWGVLRGNGIHVVPEAVGTVDEVMVKWHAGTLSPLPLWPRAKDGRCHRGRRPKS